MTWNLFIDDERNPEDVTWAPRQVQEKYRNEEWQVVRSFSQVAVVLLKYKSFPTYISFDHDLGSGLPGKSSGYDIAKALVRMDMEGSDGDTLVFPNNFSFYVHSQNPVGKKNIEEYLTNYLSRK